MKMSKKIDMTNWIMKEHGVPDSKWTVIDYAGNSKWNCVCECGTHKAVAGVTLRNGTSKSCGCDRVAPNLKNEIGNRYGRLVVLREDGLSNDKHKKWICRCDCGNEVSVIGKNLRAGLTTSCGCYRAEKRTEHNFKDLFNQTFGKLTALECIGKNQDNQFVWKCQCECGSIVNVVAHYLLNGNTTSCGCNKSKGELKIKNILLENNIEFKQQFTFDNLKYKSPLKFDFAIFKNNQLLCLIEYQGIQHYDENNLWFSEENQVRDTLKKDYCEQNNILLIEIPYWDYEDINFKYLKEKCNL